MKKLLLTLGILSFFFGIVKVSAVTLPELYITTMQYLSYDKIPDDEVEDNSDISVGETKQLYAITIYGNEMYNPEIPDSIGLYAYNVELDGVEWTSSDTSVATVTDSGLVTGLKQGTTIITARYNDDNEEKEDTYEINVKSSGYTGISFGKTTPMPTFKENEDYGFLIYLFNIPDTEKENIHITIDDSSIAKLTDIDLCNFEDNSGNGIIIADVKFLKPGDTTITATLQYKGQTYTDNYYVTVNDENYTGIKLDITSDKTTIYIGEKVQLNVHMTYENTAPVDITSDSRVVYTSSNEKIATVDSKGLVTGISAGKAIITVKYDDSVTETYEIIIEKKEDNPKTGNTGSIIIGLIFIAILLSMFVYANFYYSKSN